MRLTTKIPRYCFHTIAVLLFAEYSNSQEFKPGARNVGLCYSSIALIDSWSLFQNQAGLAWQKNYWVGVHHENKFLIKDLNYSALGVDIPVRPGTFGVGTSHFGNQQYNLYRVSVCYGMKLTNRFASGIGINYHNLNLSNNYSSSDALTVDWGIIYAITDKLTLGAHVSNPYGSSTKSKINLPTSFGLGIAYTPVKRLLLTVQADDNSTNSPVFRSGIEFLPNNSISLRTGFSSNPSCLSFGIGLSVVKLKLDIAFSYHEVLGYTPHISVSYCF